MSVSISVVYQMSTELVYAGVVIYARAIKKRVKNESKMAQKRETKIHLQTDLKHQDSLTYRNVLIEKKFSNMIYVPLLFVWL